MASTLQHTHTHTHWPHCSCFSTLIPASLCRSQVTLPVCTCVYMFSLSHNAQCFSPQHNWNVYMPNTVFLLFSHIHVLVCVCLCTCVSVWATEQPLTNTSHLNLITHLLYCFQICWAWYQIIQLQPIWTCACLNVCLNMEWSQYVSLVFKVEAYGVEMFVFVSVCIFPMMFMSVWDLC